VLAGQAAPARKRPWTVWAAVGVGALLLLAIGARATFGFARFVAFHGGRANFAAASVQRSDRRQEARQSFRHGRAIERGLRRGGAARGLRGRG